MAYYRDRVLFMVCKSSARASGGVKWIGSRVIVVEKEHGVLDDILDWCKENLTPDNWMWNIDRSSSKDWPGVYRFYFQSEDDYLLFMMRWK